MVRKSKGFRHSTRKVLHQKSSYRPTISKFLKEFAVGQRIIIIPEPSSQKGMPFPRFRGKMGTVIEKRGRSYIVKVIDGDKPKKIISRPEHLKAV